jgi:hypothetical protein
MRGTCCALSRPAGAEVHERLAIFRADQDHPAQQSRCAIYSRH